MTVGPITPKDIVKVKIQKVIPDFVLEAFNFLISQNYSNGRSTVSQPIVVDKIIELSGKTGDEAKEVRSLIYSSGWLDVEPIYEKAGWRVTYDKPGYNESYTASFEFRKKTR